MTPGVYVAGCERATGKSAVALGVQQLLTRRVERLGIFRPVVADPEHDPLIDLLRPLGVAVAPYEASCGVGYEQVRADEAGALEEIVARYRALAAQCDGVLVVGTDFEGTASELAFNARVALNLGLPALLVVTGHERTPEEIRTAISVGADDVAPLGAGRRGRGRQPRARLRARRGRRADAEPAGLRAAGGRPADGADGRPGRGRVPRRGDRGRPGAAGARGAAPDGGGDDAAEPDGSHHRRRGADHAGRPRGGAAGGDVRARVDRCFLPPPASC